jgi:hypothetical protein
MNVAQNYLANDFDRSSGSGSMSGSMTSKIMWTQIHTHHFARLVDHYPGGIVSDRENTLFRLDPLILDVFSQSVYDFLGNEDNLRFPATFRVRQCDFAVLDIGGF